jgi:adenylosuccinate synthase
VVTRYSAAINGVHSLAVTKLDVLDAFDTLRIAVAYECDGRRWSTVPGSSRVLARCRPIYEEMPGWRTGTRNVRRLEDLPPAARQYVSRLCELTGAPLGILSVGASRDSTLRIGL